MILKKARPERVQNEEQMRHAVSSAREACKTHNLHGENQTIFVDLTREIAKVFMEMRAILKRHRDQPTKRLYNHLRQYMPKIKQAILCFSYNSMKLKVCMASMRSCGAESSMTKPDMKKLIKNITRLQKLKRTWATLSVYHHKTMTKVKKLAKEVDE